MNKQIIDTLYRDLKSDDRLKRMQAIIALNTTYGISSISQPQTPNTSSNKKGGK